MAETIKIGGELESTATGNVVAAASAIKDKAKNKYQEEINTETYSLVNDVNERLSGLNPEQQSALSVATKATNNETKLGYYVCDTEDNVAAKVISNATGYILSTGGSIKVKMTNANTVDNATLNINSTGAKALYYDGERASATNSWDAGETVEVYYDGTNFYANDVAGSGGDGVFDVSEKYPTSGVEGGNTYTLAGALAVLDANLSASKKKGGMSIKFVQSSDNNYVQFRLMKNIWSIDIDDWALCSEDVLIDNPEWVKVVTDSKDKVLYGVKTDGKFYFGDGCPPQVVEHVTALLEELEGDFTTLLNTKVDKIIGKSLIDSEFADSQEVITNHEYIQVTTDFEDKILEAIKTDGTKVIGSDVEIGGNTKTSGDATILGNVDIQGATYTLQENPEWIKVLTDAHNRIIAGVMKDGSVYINNIIGVTDAIQELREAIEELSGDFYLVNPYKGVDFNNQVCAQSHEHCYNKSRLESAYNRGIRVIACSHYAPAVPRYPFSNFDRTYQDYKSKQAVLDGDLELVTRHCSGSVPTLDIDGTTVNTDDIPQIANAERPFIKGIGGHYNILGLLWGDPGHSLCNGELTNSPEDSAIKREYTLESTSKFNELLEDESMWQFGSKYAFGTINHNTSSEVAITILTRCPLIFKAMELFNQGYSAGWNDDFRSAYDAVLRAGYRIWGAAVVDWQNDWATWNFTTAEEKAEWETKYNVLSAEEQAEYGSAENYYMQTGRYKFDRGTNVLLMDDSYDNLTAEQKAKEAIKAYIDGRYYMSGLNNYSMMLLTDGKVVTFKVSDIADKIIVITGKRRFEYTNVDSVELFAKADDMYIRFEAYWNNGDFVYSNPVWVNRVEG